MADTPRVAAPLQHGKMVSLTGATTDKGILITPTSTAGETIHKNTSGSTQLIYLFGYNAHSGNNTLTLEWGGTGDGNNTGHTLATIITAEIVSGIPLGPGVTLSGFAGTADKFHVYGYAVTIG